MFRIVAVLWGVCGGCHEFDSEVIHQSCSNLSHVFFLFHEGRNPCPELPVLLKTVEELAEQEGGLEEIEAHLHHTMDLSGDKVKYFAASAKSSIFKY
ncbi:MAG: hypothetical protein EZS28_051279 [Streblomastix strix]|uniref:Uncharacterized protein n=1 Tax=Streblomastix strix TaxID=222440 RepID=A0A5J4T742_9EUKA|nr:MAG: hypothetical protein EZS28_051279 [Streblomastix strix]